MATAIVPEANKAQGGFNVRIVATFAYTAQVFFCREPVASLAALQGKRVRTGGGSINDFVNAIGAQAVGIGRSGSLHGAGAGHRRLRHHRHGHRQQC